MTFYSPWVNSSEKFIWIFILLWIFVDKFRQWTSYEIVWFQVRYTSFFSIWFDPLASWIGHGTRPSILTWSPIPMPLKLRGSKERICLLLCFVYRTSNDCRHIESDVCLVTFFVFKMSTEDEQWTNSLLLFKEQSDSNLKKDARNRYKLDLPPTNHKVTVANRGL